MTMTTVLHLPPVSESITYRWYLEPIDDEPAIGWWIRRVTSSGAVDHVHVIAHGRPDVDRLTALLGGYAATVWSAPRSGLLQTLADAAAAHDVDSLVVLPTALPLAPVSLVSKAVAHHEATQNRMTFVSGMPQGTTPVILRRDLLTTVERAQPRGGADDMTSLVKALATTRTAPGAAMPGEGAPFDAARCYGAEAAMLPRTVRLESPQALETLRRILPRLPSARDGMMLEGLIAWKHQAIEDACARRASLVSAATTPRAWRPRQRPRVLFVSYPCGFSGAEQVMAELVARIDPGRITKLALVSSEGVLAARLRQAGAMVTCSEDYFTQGGVDSVLSLAALLRDLQPDLIHLNGRDGVPLLVAATVLGVPIVQHTHIVPTDDFAEYCGAAAATITVSEFVRRHVLSFNVPRSRVQTVYNGLDTDYFRPGVMSRETLRARFGIPRDARVVVMIARIDPQKRHDVLIKAMRTVRAAVPAAHLLLNGEPFNHPRHLDVIRDLVRQCGLDDAVTWLPFVADIREVHTVADLLVLCSENDPFPRCIQEAMAMEVPVVVSDSGGHPEIVRPDETGWLVRPGDVEACAAAVIEALTDPARRARIGQQARAWMEARFSADGHAARIMAIYDRVLKEQASVERHRTLAWGGSMESSRVSSAG